MPDENAQANPLRIVVLTRTGRGSGQRLAEVVDASPHELCGVLAERRSTMWRKALKRRGLIGMLKHYGAATFLARIGQWLQRERSSTDLPVTVVSSLNSDNTVPLLKQWRPDVILIANAPILAPRVLATARVCAVNFHSGRLPDYGGVASEHWAMHDGATQAWATLHLAPEHLDSGDILAEAPVQAYGSANPEYLHAADMRA